MWETPSARLSAPLLRLLAKFAPGGLKSGFIARAKQKYRDFWALQNVSLQVNKGESMAIIGRNGSGKSTLLQIIAGTLQPTTGTAHVNGRIAALLELGSGFNPDFTGRENVHLNATLFGLSQKEIENRFEAIVSFAELEEFIDQPVKTYSSGMSVRLAFAIAAHIDPDILIVDEALSVGDARFQLKCARAIDRFIANGVTLLFVSHDSSMVKRLCRSAILLERGQVIYSGNPNDVVNLYSKLTAENGSVEDLAADIEVLRSGRVASAPTLPANSKKTGAAATVPVRVRPPEQRGGIDELRLRLKAMEAVWDSHPQSAELSRRAAELLKNERLHVQVSGQEFTYGGELGRISDLLTLDANGQPRTWFTSGEPVIVRLQVEALDVLPDPIFALTIKSVAGVEIYGTNTLFGNQPATSMQPGMRREVDFSFNMDLIPGNYFLSAGFTHFVGEQLVVVHRRYDAIKLEVHGSDRSFGIANLQAKIHSRDLPNEGGQ
jgi:ABC-type polysaccharide/polyol phosphate transport system ATPase subunit